MEDVVAKGTRFRRNAQGYALGSGNSIPEYVPAEGYLAMIEAAQKIRCGAGGITNRPLARLTPNA